MSQANEPEVKKILNSPLASIPQLFGNVINQRKTFWKSDETMAHFIAHLDDLNEAKHFGT